MARHLRIESPGAVYHVTARGDRREPIFADDDDRGALLAVAALAPSRFEAGFLVYCLMGNHCHFVRSFRSAEMPVEARVCCSSSRIGAAALASSRGAQAA